MPASCPFYTSECYRWSRQHEVDAIRRQIPYAIGQFTVNEFSHDLVYRNVPEDAKKGLGPASRFSIALGSCVVAGCAAAILSQVKALFLS